MSRSDGKAPRGDGYSVFGRRSLFWRIYFSIIIAFLIAAAIFAAQRYIARRSAAGEGGIQAALSILTSVAAGAMDGLSDEALQRALTGMSAVTELELFVQRGDRVFARPDAVLAEEFRANRLDPPPDGHIYVASAVSPSGGTKVTVAIRPWFAGHRTARFAAFAVTLVGGLILSYLIVRRYMRPLTSLREITARFAGGDLSARAGSDVLSQQETAELGEAFNVMAGRIENMVNSQKELLIAISHEIRSPLQRMEVALSLARGAAKEDEGRYLDRAEGEIERISDMVGELLMLTRDETEHYSPSPVSLDEIAREAAADAEFEGTPRGIRVALDARPAAVNGVPQLLKRAVGGVTGNAVRYAPPGSVVEIDAREEDGRAIIRVRDHGQGVPEEDLERIFEPYYRTDTARERSKGGTGLGLAITRRIAEGHGGTATARNAPGGGLEVTITLPM